MREIERTQPMAINSGILSGVVSEIIKNGKHVDAGECVSMWLENVEESGGLVEVSDVPFGESVYKKKKRKSVKPGGLLDFYATEKMTIPQLIEYLDECAWKRGRETARQRAAEVLCDFILGKGFEEIKSFSENPGWGIKSFFPLRMDKTTKYIPLPDKDYISNYENPVPLCLRDALPTKEEISRQFELPCMNLYMQSKYLIDNRNGTLELAADIKRALNEAKMSGEAYVGNVLASLDNKNDAEREIAAIMGSWNREDAGIILDGLADFVDALEERQKIGTNPGMGL